MPREYGKSRDHCLVSVLELLGFISARLIRLALFVEVVHVQIIWRIVSFIVLCVF